MQHRYVATLDIDASERLILTSEGVGEFGGQKVTLTPTDFPGVFNSDVDGRVIPIHIKSDGIRQVTVSMLGYSFTVTVLAEQHHRLHDILRHSPAMRSRVERISAPMPGLIKSVLVVNGDVIEKGTQLFTLEAMKMENGIASPISGTVSDLSVNESSTVEKGQKLCMITPAAD